MKTTVTAVVVSYDYGDYLDLTLQALRAQTRPVDRVIIVVTRPGVSYDSSELLSHESAIHLPEATFEQALSKATDGLSETEDDWLWIVHDDSAPDSDCLEQLLSLEEKSSLAALIGPKQLLWDNPRIILQQGLTLTPLGAPLSLVAGELDQSQHDDASDVLAVGTAGALVRMDVWQQVGGLSKSAPPLAADYDLALRIKLAGFRVLVAPKARLRHRGRSLEGERPRKWLGGTPKTAIRKAQIHIRMAYSPLWVALGFWLLSGPIIVVRVLWRLLQKRPDRISSEILAGIWGFFTLFARLSGRTKHSSRAVKSVLAAFSAPWSAVRQANRSHLDSEEAQDLREAFDRGEHELNLAAKGKTFVQSGGLFWMALLLGLSYNFLPTNIAAAGANVAPLSHGWYNLFTRAGSSWQPFGEGFFAPAEPFNWVLLAISGLTPWAPSLSIVLTLFLAPTIAFAGAWRMATLVSSRTWVRNTVALTFALWPSFVEARSEGRITSVLAIVLLPWLVFSVARAAGLGRSGSNRSMRQTWSWVGLSGLLLAAAGVSSPSLVIPVFLALAITAFTRIRRFGYLLWIPLPFMALYTPLAVYLAAGLSHPLALLADPGLANSTSKTSLLGLVVPGDWANLLGYGYLAAVALAALALLSKRWILASALWLFGLVVVEFAYLHQSIEYANPGAGIDQQTANGSPAVLLAALGLVLLTLFALAAENHSRVVRIGMALTASLLLLVPLGASAALASRDYQMRDDRVVPWLLDASAQSGSNDKLLVIRPAGGSFSAHWLPIGGARLEDASVAYRYALADLNGKDAGYKTVSELVAKLVSANGENLNALLSTAHVSHILVANDDSATSAELANALDTIGSLEAAGLTEFGRLWRVTVDVTPAPAAARSPWSITKVVQLFVLVSFALLALPTTGSSRRRAKEASIFIEAEGENT
jgi:GT2 family glycosyltransferase